MPKRPRTSLPFPQSARGEQAGSFRSLLERTLPSEALTNLREVDAALKDHVVGGLDREATLRRAQRALDKAFKAAARARRGEEKSEPIDLSTVVARRLRDHRERAGLTQSRLSEDLKAWGFGWSRVTVAEVEGGSRKVALEELFSLAEYFDVPMAELFMPINGEAVALRPYAHGVEASLARERILGRGGFLGAGLLEGEDEEEPSEGLEEQEERTGRAQTRSRGRKQRGGKG